MSNPSSSTPASKVAHTPTPWHRHGPIVYAAGDRSGNICALSEPRATEYAEYAPLRFNSADFSEANANGDFIVQACNAHDDLLSALRGVTRILEAFSYTTTLAKGQRERLDAARAAIALAEGSENVQS